MNVGIFLFFIVYAILSGKELKKKKKKYSKPNSISVLDDLFFPGE